MLDMTVYSEEAIARSNATQLADSLDYFSPDVVVVPAAAYRYEIQQTLSDSVPVVSIDTRASTVREVAAVDGIRLVLAPTYDALSTLTESDHEQQTDDVEDTYLLSNLLDISINPTRLETTLDGRQEYEQALPADLQQSYSHLTGRANPSYRATWGELELQGVLPGANEQQTGAKIARLTLQSDGIVTTTARDISAFGLRALSQIGQTRAQTLRDAGLETPEQIVDSTVSELQELSDFGRSTADTVRRSAEAFVDGTVYRHGNGTLPNAEPIFVDIETDGLNPTMVWLIGVLDRQGGETYLSFLGTDPDAPEEAVEAFASWLVGNGKNRPVVAYNGYSFDFPVIEEHIEQHCPQYLAEWQDVWTFDPYHWAVTENEAILPGRTNKLEDVAPALGWETRETGLSGETVARLFQAYMADPSPETELDWERHERYCEDDVRSLAFVYDALADASRRTPQDDTGQSRTKDETAQGRLSDF